MRDTLLTVVNDSGTPWLVRIVRNGDRYGLNDCLTHSGDLPMVEFYDLRYMHTERGQYVSRYFMDTLQGVPVGRGLNLDGGVPSWTIDGVTFSRIMEWISDNA